MPSVFWKSHNPARYKTQAALDHKKAGTEDEGQGEVFKEPTGINAAQFIYGITCFESWGWSHIPKKEILCHTEPRSVGCIVDRVQAMENVKGTQRNNGNDWHKDCSKTQQPHWHSVGFQAAGRGSLPCTKAHWKGVCPTEQCQGCLQLGSSWLGDLRRGVTLMDFTPLQKGAAVGAL